MKKPFKNNLKQYQTKMKKIIAFLIISIVLFSCASKTNNADKLPLYEILKQEDQGGANFKFFEIISEPKEFKMLLNDADLKKKIKAADIYTCNFLLLNMGTKSSGGYYFTIENIEEMERDSQSGKILVGIGERCFINNAIVDKNCRIGNDVKINGGSHLPRWAARRVWV